MTSAYLPTPAFFPSVHKTFTDYLAFDFNWTAVFTAIYLAYYYALDPVAAVSFPATLMQV